MPCQNANVGAPLNVDDTDEQEAEPTSRDRRRRRWWRRLRTLHTRLRAR